MEKPKEKKPIPNDSSRPSTKNPNQSENQPSPKKDIQEHPEDQNTG